MNAPVDPHPSADTLRAFGSGRLDDATAEAVVAHFGLCPSCRDQAASLSGDSFVARLRAVHDRRATPAPPVPPELRDHPQYEVLRELGRGGMGVVYLAKNKLMGRQEVLKVVHRDLLDHADAAARFLREICSAANLNHPNIVTAYAALQVGASLALAMEYVEGEDLARVVAKSGPLPVANACYYAAQAAMGLQHAFEKGMVHRDIKPHNLILARDSKKHIVKILDFGLAKATQANGEAVQKVTGLHRKLTKFGAIMGTPDYIAPEQITDAASADVRADLYSLGCTLYVLLTGGPPFAGANLEGLLAAHLMQQATPVNEIRPEVPAELAAVVARLMAKEPGHRYQKPVEVAQALAPFVKGGIKPLPPGALPAGEKATGAPGAVTAAGSDTRLGAKVVMNPNSGQPAGAPAPVLRETVIEMAAMNPSGGQPARRPAPVLRPTVLERSPRLPAAKPNQAPRSTGRKGARPWLIGGGFGLAILLAGLIGRWSAGVSDETPPQPKIAASTKKDVLPSPKAPLKEEKAKAVDAPPVVKAPVEAPKAKAVEVPPVAKAPFTAEKAKELQHAWAKYLGRKVVEEVDLGDGVTMEFVLIPPGTFTMGSPGAEKERGEDEVAHEVTITKPFYLGKYEVTQAQYEQLVGKNPSKFQKVAGQNTRRFPVENICWVDAEAYCKKLGRKLARTVTLPSEAQWEYACRAGTTTPFHFGSQLNGAEANCRGDFPHGTSDKGPYLERTCRVGLYAPNAWGLYDMHGNVWEWCQDWYGPYPKEYSKDPQGANNGNVGVLRGGAWCVHPSWCRAAERSRGAWADRSDDCGCRVVLCLD